MLNINRKSNNQMMKFTLKNNKREKENSSCNNSAEKEYYNNSVKGWLLKKSLNVLKIFKIKIIIIFLFK